MNTTSRWLAMSLWLPLAACQNAPLGTIPTLQGSDGNGLRYSLPPDAVDLQRFAGPAQLAGLKAAGQLSRPGDHGWRQWRYRDAQVALRVTVYGLPGGWQDLSPQRIVSGHYGQLRQERVDRVYHSADQSIRFQEERRFDLQGQQSVSARFIINEADRDPLYETLLLTLRNGLFIRVETASRHRDSRALHNLAKRALAEFEKANRGK
ncbi:hypothetical protein CEK62_07280 [Alcanivorax sp. N3-2A]|nr:hypothetical protein CEK62_07280 [Alcanivorax sp. N3-2A]|tara:strand:- start:4828 stop:5448 length:621 start_codon:yes stop_codon:yes gene_type:complete